MSSIAPHIEAFLREHLARHRGASQHTCDSYAYSFQSLFGFASQRLKVAPSALTLEQLDAPLVSSFLEHLETTRQNSAQTRNIRLAAIRSFFRFLQHREPAALDQVRRVLAIPFKKTDTRLVPYLNQDEVQALLDAPDPTTREGIRDRAVLHLAVCAGLRVSELTGLRIDDVTPQSTGIRVRGKGRRERALPLWKTAASALRAWQAVRGAVAASELFVNARGEPFSRWGIAYVLRRHAHTASQQCPSLRSKPLSPHVLRHTCAMVVLQATQDIRKVSLWLGHSNMATTEIYVRADPSEKLEAIEAVVPPHLRKGQVSTARQANRALEDQILMESPNGVRLLAARHSSLHSPYRKTPHKTRVVDTDFVFARIAAFEMTSQGRGAAIDQRIEHPKLLS